VSRGLQQLLHSRLETVATLRDLPLTAQQIEVLALDLTPCVKAMLAESDAQIEELAPVAYALAGPAEPTDRCVTEYAGCTSAIHPEVDVDCPAALLAHELAQTQPDVTATDVPTPAHLTLTVRPQSVRAWTWWLHKMSVHTGTTLRHGPLVTGTGHYGEITVHLRGENVGQLLDDQAAAQSANRLRSFIAPPAARRHPW
jgi:hypothetical protein